MKPSAQKIQIRQATTADLEPLCRLLGILFAQEADFAPDAARQERSLRLILKQPETGRIYCASEGTAVVGMVSLLFTVSTAEGGPAAWLEDMVILPDRRGQGLGEQLLQEAIRQARLAGCRRLTLLTDATNDAAQRFYGRAGFVRSQMIPLRLKL